ncbi:MAG TPA: hypothetical protein VK671_09395 [Mucilaginibacter sp.]|nr:hypothetical protein [Mucilaginibacter sp.]
METIFVFTHAVMSICLIGIIYMSIPPADNNDQETKRSVLADLVLKVKSMQVTSTSIYHTAVGLLAVLIK